MQKVTYRLVGWEAAEIARLVRPEWVDACISLCEDRAERLEAGDMTLMEAGDMTLTLPRMYTLSGEPEVLILSSSCFERKVEYDGRDWAAYPTSVPKKDGWYCAVDGNGKRLALYRDHAVWRQHPAAPVYTGRVMRFCPWPEFNEPEAEDEPDDVL